MPSAANVKLDKQQIPSTENALADTGNATSTPLRQAITVIEHKIRNLEKRKSKLESYRDLQNAGKELNSDQKTALAKINEVIMTLDFARDLNKQIQGIATSSEKEAKKQAKREASLKNQAELARLREILLVQDALNQMGSDGVREDFLNGRNGAAQLTETDLKLLDDLYPAVTPKHEAGNPTVFTNEVQAAAEHLLAVVDGKPKEVFGGTYSQIKEILGKIHESGYFDQSQEAPLEEENVELSAEPPVGPLEQSEQSVPELSEDSSPFVCPIESLTIEASSHGHTPTRVPPVVPVEQPPVHVPVPQHPVPPVVMDHPGVAVPPPNHQPPPPEMFYQPQPPAPRPISEVLGAGSFYFLQESEIDTPEQIPTQTFTNQTFTGQPPPPIPMPPHFQPAVPQQISPNALPPVMNHQVPPNGAPLPPQPVSNEEVTLIQPTAEDVNKHSLVGRGPPPNNHQQSFYNNNSTNNGYSNRVNSGNRQYSRNNGLPQQHQGRPQPNRH